jgi:uncharacterized phage-like protein YoqJ
MTYSIGVTGHRTIKGKEVKVKEKVKEFLSLIAEERPGEEIRVISGMAIGFDQLVCLVCAEMNIPYVAAVPCENQDALWKPLQKEIYKMLIEGAVEVVQVSPGPYEPWKMHARNAWIVNNSSEMIVHWDGLYTGGTGQCMKLVKNKRLPFRNTISLNLGDS